MIESSVLLQLERTGDRPRIQRHAQIYGVTVDEGLDTEKIIVIIGVYEVLTRHETYRGRAETYTLHLGSYHELSLIHI